MSIRLLSSLVLAVWAQQAENPGPPPRSIREIRVELTLIDAAATLSRGEPREITLELPAPAEGDDGPPRPRPPVGHIDLKTAVVAQENFDRWLFGDERTQEQQRRHLEEILDAKIWLADLERKLTLTAQQRSKLRVAGRGDIKRFFDQVEEKRAQFETERQKYKTGLAALRRLAPLKQIYTEGPFGDGSLFAKTFLKVKEERRAGLSSASGEP